MKVSYEMSRSKAFKLKTVGYGITNNIKDYNLMILQKIELDELTHLVAIAYFIAKKENKNFYSCLSKEIARMGMYMNQKNKKPILNTTDLKNDRQVVQLYNLYRIIGFAAFYKYLNIIAPKSTVQKWCNNCFGQRKDEKRGSRKMKRKVLDVLENGGNIRFSETTTSVYISNNEQKIRISNHLAYNEEDITINILLPKE